MEKNSDLPGASPPIRKRSFTTALAGLFFVSLGMAIASVGICLFGLMAIMTVLQGQGNLHPGALANLVHGAPQSPASGIAGLVGCIFVALGGCIVISLGGPLVRVGCGLWERRSRARICAVVTGILFLLFGTAVSVLGVRGMMIAAAISLFVGTWWTVYFTHKRVRPQFDSRSETGWEETKALSGKEAGGAVVLTLILAVVVSFFSPMIAEILAPAGGGFIVVVPALAFTARPLTSRFRRRKRLATKQAVSLPAGKIS